MNLKIEAYRDGVKRKGGKIGMGYMKHGLKYRFEHADTPTLNHTIPILLPGVPLVKSKFEE